MTVTVLIWRIDDTYDDGGWGATTYQAGYYIHVLFDTVTKAISVQIRTGSTEGGGSLIASPTSGPNLFYGYNGAATRIFPTNLEDLYAACDGTTLDYINQLNTFPYGGYAFEEDSPSCYVAPVCDLEFSSTYTTVKASGPSIADGGFTVSATSSNGTVKYSLTPNFDYASATNTTGVFTGLLPGDYTVYAKDPINCQDTLSITVEITEEFGVRWRHEFQDNVNNWTIRLDIEERAYDGDIEEICAGESPVIIDYKGDPNDLAKPVVPSIATINILSESNGQFQEIFLGDDLKYRTRVSIDYGSGFELYHLAYAIPEFYEEPYLALPFPVTFTATDGLGELAQRSFLDSNDNNYRGEMSVIKIISEILKKTPLEFKIRSCYDVYETTMNATASDDPLAQLYVDMGLFFTTKNGASTCQEVLEKLLRPLRAKLFQSDGYWYIVRVSKSVADTLSYRQFTVDGEYESNGTISPGANLSFPQDTNCIAWRDKSQVLAFIRNYGFFRITHNLGKDSNLIDEGGFELTDIVENGSGDLFFKNWNFVIGQTGMTYGHEQVPGATGAFFAKYSQITSAQNDSILYTRAIPCTVSSGSRIKVKFKVHGQVYNVFPWVRIGWQLKITNLDTGDFHSFYAPQNDISDFETNQEVINDLYIEKFNNYQEFELGLFHLISTTENATIQLLFYFHNHWGRDYNDYPSMRGETTAEHAGKDKRLYFGDTSTIYYKLVRTIEAESEPTRIRPTDYNAVSNPQQWELQEDYALGPFTSIVSKFLFDDVQISFYPYAFVDGVMKLIDPPETASYEQEVSRFVKFNFTQEVFLGDCPDFDNAENLYKGYFRLSDSTPTEKWAREGVTEEEYLLQIQLNDMIAQMSDPVRKLRGSVVADRKLTYLNFIKDYQDNKKYLNTNFNYELKYSSFALDLVEVKTGSDGNPPAELGEFSVDEFSDDFNTGE